MQIQLKSVSDVAGARSACLVLPVSGKPSPQEQALDRALGGTLQRLRKRGDLPTELGKSLLLPETGGLAAERLLLLGRGDAELDEGALRKLAGALLKALGEARASDALLLGGALPAKAPEAALTQLALQASLAEYRYTRTLSKPKPALALKRLLIDIDNSAAHRSAAARGLAIGKGMNLARRLGDLPGNLCTPSDLAREARSLARGSTQLKVSVLEEKKMRELGMGALLSVSAGSAQPAKLIVLEYRGAAKSSKPQVLVGKGVTFDTGGISLKPGAKMDEMKYDMCGAASVLGTFAALLELAPRLNVVGIIAAAENMPGGTATKPGDVVTSLSGQTIEILNTDAEGRLVLCDALTYAGRYKPAAVIDIATLTGACVVALGKHATGLYSNQDDFAAELLSAGERVGDRAWHMPLWEDYQSQLDSNFADIANVGGPEAGSVTAACFLSRFTRDYRWAHLDIAGTAWHSGGNKGATGRPVALLCQYLLEQRA